MFGHGLMSNIQKIFQDMRNLVDKNSQRYKKYILPYVVKKHQKLNDVRNNMDSIKIEFLEKANTKHLLGLLKRSRYSCNGWLEDTHQPYISVLYYKKGGEQIELHFTPDELKTELRNRPDLSNKKIKNVSKKKN